MFFATAAAFCQVSPNIISGKTFFLKEVSKIIAAPRGEPSPSMLISPSFYSCNLAFFCRQELKLEKVTKIPFKFRLGSVQQVDFLEGKRASY